MRVKFSDLKTCECKKMKVLKISARFLKFLQGFSNFFKVQVYDNLTKRTKGTLDDILKQHSWNIKKYLFPSHALGRFIKLGKVWNWQGPEILVFYGKFNLLLYSPVSKSELSKEKFNLVLFPDDKMRSEPASCSHCGHPEMCGKIYQTNLGRS